jgi:hypothetical protein
MTAKRMYVSGGLGARYEGEAFGRDYELPNERAYTETCAAIGGVMWNHRLLLATGEARFADLLEHTLYNAVLPGVSLDGQSYFYQNPLADDGTHRRQPWFGCACCPPNVARLLAQLPGYFYGTSDDGDVFVHLYAEGAARIPRPDGLAPVMLTQQTNYPWDGDVEIAITGEGAFGVGLRIPAWCDAAANGGSAGGVRLDVNGELHDQAALVPGSYVLIRREWRPGDTVHLHLPMPVRRVRCHPYVAENAGRVAVFRGPLLYCAEAVDHADVADLRDLVLPSSADLSPEPRPDLLNGVVALRGEARVDRPDDAWNGALYRTAATPRPDASPAAAAPLTLVPYYAWANRAPGRLQVWLREVPVADGSR